MRFLVPHIFSTENTKEFFSTENTKELWAWAKNVEIQSLEIHSKSICIALEPQSILKKLAIRLFKQFLTTLDPVFRGPEIFVSQAWFP